LHRETTAEGRAMSLQKDKVEWELPHFKEAHQMQVSYIGGPVPIGQSCVHLILLAGVLTNFALCRKVTVCSYPIVRPCRVV